MTWILIIVMSGIPYPTQSYSDPVNCQAEAFNIEATSVGVKAYCLPKEDL